MIFDWIALIALYVCYFYKKWKKSGSRVLVINTLLYIYISFVFFFTLMPFFIMLPNAFTTSYQWMYLIAFDDVINARGNFSMQIVLNILLTVPFGFFMGIMKKTWIKVVLLTSLLSLSIELIQPISGNRISDITDLITNTFGGMMGYYSYLLFKPNIEKWLLRLESHVNASED